jgi:zinc/manganese transport system ATP-binding protein
MHALACDLVGPVMSAAAEGAVVFRDLTLTYERHPAVHHLSGALARGSLTAIVGPNGAGKSTLLKGIVGQMRPAEGMIERADLGRRGIAYLPQHAEIERRFPISVLDTVLLGHWRQIGWAGAVTKAMGEKARKALAAVGLDGFERRPIETLSVGQFQRVLFARLIVQDAELILLDEPFAAVDWRTSEDLLHLVESWHRERRTVAAGPTRPRPGPRAFSRYPADRPGMRRLGRDPRGGDPGQSAAGPPHVRSLVGRGRGLPPRPRVMRAPDQTGPPTIAR